MTVESILVDPGPLRSLYGGIPDLTGVRIRSVNLNWRGPTVTLRLDMPSFPGSAPQEWIDAGMDTVQCQFQFLAVDGLLLTNWVPPVVGDVKTTPWGTERRMKVSVRSTGMSLEFDCSDSVRVGHVTAFAIHEDGSDRGRHLFLSKVDARRHDTLPGTTEKTFYER
ncbi:Imm50 family immunity protein [Streptomyces sp. NPDC001507]|uniref:Imm50 family immunity protein n=1 Tax=Streptomyces sp. NPDC001507 TaxID=3364579 RepID=UPI0036A45041